MGPVILLWSGSRSRTSGTEKHPRDSKEATGYMDKARVASRHRAKSPCPNCGTDANFSTKSDPRIWCLSDQNDDPDLDLEENQSSLVTKRLSPDGANNYLDFSEPQ